MSYNLETSDQNDRTCVPSDTRDSTELNEGGVERNMREVASCEEAMRSIVGGMDVSRGRQDSVSLDCAPLHGQLLLDLVRQSDKK